MKRKNDSQLIWEGYSASLRPKFDFSTVRVNAVSRDKSGDIVWEIECGDEGDATYAEATYEYSSDYNPSDPSTGIDYESHMIEHPKCIMLEIDGEKVDFQDPIYKQFDKFGEVKMHGIAVEELESQYNAELIDRSEDY